MTKLHTHTHTHTHKGVICMSVWDNRSSGCVLEVLLLSPECYKYSDFVHGILSAKFK